MTPSRNTILAACAAACAFAAASATAAPSEPPSVRTAGTERAANAPGEGRPGTSEFRRGMGAPSKMAARHIDRLKEELKIRPEQQAAWDAFASTILARADKMAKTRDDMRKARADRDGQADRKGMPASERMAKARDQAKERLAAIEEAIRAHEALSAALDPAQRETLDRTADKMFREHPGHGKRGG